MVRKQKQDDFSDDSDIEFRDNENTELNELDDEQDFQEDMPTNGNGPYNQRSLITHDVVKQRREGFTKLTSAEELRHVHKEFQSALSYVQAGTAATALPVGVEDITVETPSEAIENAITREIEQYRALLSSSSVFQGKKSEQSYESLPDLGASVPNIVDLEEPLADLLRERFNSLTHKHDPNVRNAVTSNQQMEELEECTQSGESVPLRDAEVLLRVGVYTQCCRYKLHEIILTGNNTLADLRDCIACTSDDMDKFHVSLDCPVEVCHARHIKGQTGHCVHGQAYGDKTLIEEKYYPNATAISEEKFHEISKRRRQGKPLVTPCMQLPHPSGFFFIEDTFYDDLRAPSSFRLSDGIVQWAASQYRHLDPHQAPYKQATMNQKQDSLKIRLGSHYLYQHQGECKHTLIFSEMRIHTPNDILDQRMYPMMVYHQIVTPLRCCCCFLWADINVHESKIMDVSPAYMCEGCYDSLHKNSKGEITVESTRIPFFPISRPWTKKGVVVKHV